MLCSLAAFLSLDSHFSSKQLLSVYGLLEFAERGQNLPKEKENRGEIVTNSMETCQPDKIFLAPEKIVTFARNQIIRLTFVSSEGETFCRMTDYANWF